MRLTWEKDKFGKNQSGIRKCDLCGREEFKKKPRRWDICASCDMKKRFDAGKNIPPIQVKKEWYYNICKNCGDKFEIISKYYHDQPYCSNKCYIQAIQQYICLGCGEKIKKSKHNLCAKCNTKRWSREEGRVYLRNKFKVDIQYKLSVLLRSRVYGALERELRHAKVRKDKTYDEIGNIELLIGCSLEELKIHIESQFKSGMTWSNWKHDGWHIDHIIPISKFDLTNKEEVLKACHFSNLQPLWAKENMQKRDKMIDSGLIYGE